MTLAPYLAAGDVVQADHPAVHATASALRTTTNVLALRTAGLPAELARP
ncbi:hypothetical protein KZZ52_25090 [Dactylosporangium sp. AC04546]|nr:hypothetical protein [Dactylosporangium sp. AC04546]WVK88547.1 hypothetical protein KZZ52_25090 [Dactylosporangium sp. AC04546]